VLPSSTENFDIAIAGAGPAGLLAALAFSSLGLRIAVIDPALAADAPARRDMRSTALLAGSVTMLENLGIWPALESESAPLSAIRLVDALGGLVRAPEVLFEAADHGLLAFGWNVPNAHFTAILRERLFAMQHSVTFVSHCVAGLAVEHKSISVLLEASIAPAPLTAMLLVAADGRASVVRKLAGLDATTWRYPQVAIATQFRHSRAHRGISTELHRPAGPLTTVPLPGNASSLVWVETEAEAARIAALSEKDFLEALDSHLAGLLGALSGLAPRSAFPLSGLSARALTAPRVALIGEAAHVVPPIGAQGFNLAARDIAWLADCVADARAQGGDIGGADVRTTYESARRSDIAQRTTAIDLLNRSLAIDLLPMQALRGLGLHAMSALAPLRRRAVAAGLGPSGPLPRLMQRKGVANSE
jgi:2-octaprenyl-6-methoxyphenol hydroxylase